MKAVTANGGGKYKRKEIMRRLGMNKKEACMPGHKHCTGSNKKIAVDEKIEKSAS